MKIVVTPPFTEEQKGWIKEAAGTENELVFCDPQDVTEEMIKDTEVILGNLADLTLLSQAKKLRWIQLNSAGTQGYCEPGVLPKGAVLTNATGAYGFAISEHMVGCLFMLRKKLHLYYANQLQHEWKNEGSVCAVEGSNVLVIGLGDIGTSFAKRMKALGCYVIGVKRRTGAKPEAVDELHGMEALNSLLPQADVIAMSLPENPSTYHVLSRDRISLLKENAIVLNVGRGTAIDTDALSEALYAGKIAGAALDVTDPEPLPVSHPIWDAPGAIITPHISGGYALSETLLRIARICASNLKRYRNGEKLENIVDMETGYRR